MSSRNNPRKRFEARAGATALSVLEHRFRRKSPIEAEEAGARLGRLIFGISKKHRRIAERNLILAMPELCEAERNKIIKGVFEHFGRVAGDFLRSTVRSNAEVLESVDGADTGYQALSLGTGLIAVTAHFGNWERFAHWFTATGGKITVVAREANDRGMQAQVQRIREKSGIQVLARGRSTRALIEKLKNGEMLGLLPDQNSEESYLPFFNKPCGTVLGPAKLQKVTGAPIITAFCPRVGPAKYKIIVDETLEPGMPFEETMTRVNASIERVIREFPEQWLWIHDRWKSARHKGLL